MEVGEGVVQVVEAIAALVDVDIDAWCDAQLDEALIALVRAAHRLNAVTCRLASRWDARQVWAADGSRSARARLARDTHTSQPSAARLLRRARALRAMPVVAGAFCSGEVSADHVDLLAAAKDEGRAELLARDEAMLVVALDGLRVEQCAKVVGYWCQRADQEIGAGVAPPAVAPSTLSIGEGVGGETHLVAHLDPIDGAQINAALHRIATDLRRIDRDAGRPRRTIGQLRAAALVEMARRAMAAPSGIRSSRPLLTILCGDATFAHLCELSTGRVVTPRSVVPHLHDLDVQTIIYEGPHKAIGASNRRTFSGVLRRAIEARDRHCQHPSGCDEPVDRCDVDHIAPWRDGGPTDQTNGQLMCTFHNRIAAAGTRPPPSPVPDVVANAPPLTG